MKISAEISLYPLQKTYDQQILKFIEKITANKDITTETSAMSTLLTGDYDEIMTLISDELKGVFKYRKAVCILKISNGCIVDEQSE
jgi:uncharacterized protein YqgV (UPF0045/DUF77 family)